MLKLTGKQMEFLSLLIAMDSLGNSSQKVPCEKLSQIGGLKEVLKCRRFTNMNKTAEKQIPFGKEEHVIAAGIDETIRNAVASFVAKHVASLKMKKLDVKNLNMVVSVMSAKKANGKFMSTPQTWHQDHKSDTIV